MVSGRNPCMYMLSPIVAFLSIISSSASQAERGSERRGACSSLLPSSRRGSRVCGTETGNSNTHQATPACALEFTGGALTTLSVDLTEYILLICSSLDRAGAGSVGRGGVSSPPLVCLCLSWQFANLPHSPPQPLHFETPWPVHTKLVLFRLSQPSRTA